MDMTKENIFKKIISREFLCAVFLLASIWLSIVSFINTSPAEQTLSSIGAADRVWFFAWGLTSAFGVYLGLRILADRLKFTSKIFNTVALVGSFAVMLPTIIMGDLIIQKVFHWGGGMTFGIACYLCILIMLVVKSKREKKFSLIIPLILIAAAIDVAFIFYMGLTALCEITILVVCEIVLFYTLYIEKAGFADEMNKDIIENLGELASEADANDTLLLSDNDTTA